jgi:RimJ/RimL family protein N-acetyltransferase
VREATKGDKEPLMRFVSKTWSWGDYVPEVWEAWLKDQNGRLLVAELDGRPVGMCHIRLLDDGVGWMEGARIHPAHRGEGIATTLGAGLIEFGLSKGIKTFRLVSGADNEVAHRQVEKLGFTEKARFARYRKSHGRGYVSQRVVRKIRSKEQDSSFRFARSSS